MPEVLVGPTPDDGVRRSSERPWDESSRPLAPDEPADATGHGAGEQLVQIHDHLRGELRQIVDLIAQVEAGRLSVGDARDAISQTTLRQNSWTLGAYCASYCRVLTTHHTIEDRSMFPSLVAREPGLGPVVDRLQEEHEVIHEVLERLDRALVAMVRPGGDLVDLRAVVDLLQDTLLSHLSYEETQLYSPLGRLGFV